jgi:hypothetical protein
MTIDGDQLGLTLSIFIGQSTYIRVGQVRKGMVWPECDFQPPWATHLKPEGAYPTTTDKMSKVDQLTDCVL